MINARRFLLPTEFRIPKAKAGANRPAGSVVLNQGLAIAGEVLDLDRRTEIKPSRQVKSQAILSAGVPESGASLKLRPKLNCLVCAGYFPGDTCEKVAVAAVLGQVLIVVSQIIIIPEARLERQLQIVAHQESQRGLEINGVLATLVDATPAVGFVLRSALQGEPEGILDGGGKHMIIQHKRRRFITGVVE